jgi:hypothetical protein
MTSEAITSHLKPPCLCYHLQKVTDFGPGKANEITAIACVIKIVELIGILIGEELQTHNYIMAFFS